MRESEKLENQQNPLSNCFEKLSDRHWKWMQKSLLGCGFNFWNSKMCQGMRKLVTNMNVSQICPHIILKTNPNLFIIRFKW